MGIFIVKILVQMERMVRESRGWRRSCKGYERLVKKMKFVEKAQNEVCNLSVLQMIVKALIINKDQIVIFINQITPKIRTRKSK